MIKTHLGTTEWTVKEFLTWNTPTLMSGIFHLAFSVTASAWHFKFSSLLQPILGLVSVSNELASTVPVCHETAH